jgi:hypothetical protein
MCSSLHGVAMMLGFSRDCVTNRFTLALASRFATHGHTSERVAQLPDHADLYGKYSEIIGFRVCCEAREVKNLNRD